MAYDAYGDRSHRGGYFDDSSDLGTQQFVAEPRENTTSWDRSTSNARQRSFPINDRMTSSPERPEPTGIDNVSPELIAVITEKVKREVAEHLARTGSVEEPPRVPQAPPAPAPVPQAPPLQRQMSNISSSTSSPPPTARGVYTPPSPTQAQSQTPKPTNIAPPMEQTREPSREPVRSPPSSPLDKSSGVRFSDRTPTARPSPGRTFSTMELSTIDQKWGRLFDNEGRATLRLGQFLRGLANHIIDDFQPRKSIVVTPTKMAMYYSSHPIDKEPNPLLSIFGAQSNEQISRLYQNLGCEHHLVQDRNYVPTIPALTPLGFAQWMTIHILAYPDEESKRLQKVVLAMPIDADGEMVDGKPERLPKQISRHLLPEREDRKSRKLVNNAIQDFLEDLGKSSSRRKASIVSPSLSRYSFSSQSRPHPVEIHQARTSPTSPKAQLHERERNPYTGAPSASESSSNEEPVKIERDRQPYTAQPGNGKVYNEGNNLNIPKHGRANSTSRTREPEAVETREARHHRTRSNASQNSYVPPPHSAGRRASSPPLKKYSDSTPTDIHVSGSKYGPGPSATASSAPSQPSSFPPPPPPIEIRNNRERRSRDDRQYRRGTDEEARFTGEFNSPKDAERWDRYQEAQVRETDRTDRPYESRASVSVDPHDPRDPRELNRDSRGAAYEDWYREKPRGPGYDTYARNY